MLEAVLPPRPRGFWANYLKGGVFALLARRADRFKITRMDEAGFSSMAGRTYAWADIMMVDRTLYTLLGAKALETVHIRVRQGDRLTLPLSEANNAAELLDYFLQHAPRT
jgi:hypothetical protein